eukprot:scaffold3352_cov326-Prasinococcus_capsulatus_cf.AAC.6
MQAPWADSPARVSRRAELNDPLACPSDVCVQVQGPLPSESVSQSVLTLASHVRWCGPRVQELQVESGGEACATSNGAEGHGGPATVATDVHAPSTPTLSRSRHVQSLLISAAAPLTTGAPASRRSPLAAPPLRPTGTRTPRQPPPSRDGCRRRPDCSCRCRRRQGELWWLCGGRDAAGGPLGRSPRTRPAPAGREQRAPPKTAA